MKRQGKIYTNISTERWEPWTGCIKISEGCKYCWAIYSLNLLKKKGISPYRDMANPFHFSINDNELQNPSLFTQECSRAWTKPTLETLDLGGSHN